MHILKIDAKPLSVNAAWKGRRFKSGDYKEFEIEVGYLLPRPKKALPKGTHIEVHFRFYLTNAASTDYDNLIKPIQDILVKNGFIEDDRYVYYASQRKIASDKNYIEVEIRPLSPVL